MPKTKQELNELKKEYEKLSLKLKELSSDELKEVTGGESIFDVPDSNKNNNPYAPNFYHNDVDKNKFIK